MRYSTTFEIQDIDEIIHLRIIFWSEPDLTDVKLNAVAKKKAQQWLNRFDSGTLNVNQVIETYALED